MSTGAPRVFPQARGSLDRLPMADYWRDVARRLPKALVAQLREQFDLRLGEFRASDLHPPEAEALALLEQIAADGWIERVERIRCARQGDSLTPQEAAGVECPYCHASLNNPSDVVTEIVFTHQLPPVRTVDWVVAVHGMNTTGAWQEAFSWKISTTWGQSVPVAIYKYGIVIAGVILAWRRRSLQHDLRVKLAVLEKEARKRGFSGKPDLIAHSFGTWLIGHLLEDELKCQQEDRLRFGRVILTGCILRPDFDWARIKNARLVDDVMNHYGTADIVVPCAQATIWDSGPSGRRGFDGAEVINVRAAGMGHSDLFSIDRSLADGRTALETSYWDYWRPFLTLPQVELVNLPERCDPARPWRPLVWILRGTIFPLIALPLVMALMATLAAITGRLLWPWTTVLIAIAKMCLAGLIVILVLIAVTLLFRALRTMYSLR
jgi:hypothetical protein